MGCMRSSRPEDELRPLKCETGMGTGGASRGRTPGGSASGPCRGESDDTARWRVICAGVRQPPGPTRFLSSEGDGKESAWRGDYASGVAANRKKVTVCTRRAPWLSFAT